MLDVARELFATQGYKATLTEEIVRRVGASRGMLYHHFRDKAALFAAVHLEQRIALAHTISERIQVTETTPRQQGMLTVCQAFIDGAVDPRVQRILFVDGPAVLGQQALRDHKPALLLLQQVFEPLMAEGVIDPLPLDPLIHLVWAMCFEAGVYIAQAEDSAAARQEMMGSLDSLLSGLERA